MALIEYPRPDELWQAHQRQHARQRVVGAMQQPVVPVLAAQHRPLRYREAAPAGSIDATKLR